MGTPPFMVFDSAPDACAPYSHAVESDGWLWITGQMPNYPNDHTKPLPAGIEAQTRNVSQPRWWCVRYAPNMSRPIELGNLK
ncbi:putative endoribonuclease L-PSP [Mycobacterium basiliense]|uniref:Putative endoribonuclease L-PSP n=1 Tax=Mycobacterium basiliense TaxID=2094119 RepID=A0A3S4FQW8_9MYCO|nr:putative endoribonuclease L-PSP [Mycobacterium basiliense]